MKFVYLVDYFKGKLCKILYGKKIKIGKRFCIKSISNLSLHKGSLLTIGDHVRINKNATVGNSGKFLISNHVSINRNCVLVCHDSICIGENTSIGPNVLIYDHDHKFGSAGKEAGFKTAPVHIGSNVWIGGGEHYFKRHNDRR